MQTEYDSLLSNGAIPKVQESPVQAWVEQGLDVEILPGRGVPSEKPPLAPGTPAKKKYRAVICGNFQRQTEERSTETFSAGGADSISIRTCLRWGGLYGHGISGVDIKTAFLNAPKDEKEPEYLLPKQMVAAGVVPRNVKC